MENIVPQAMKKSNQFKDENTPWGKVKELLEEMKKHIPIQCKHYKNYKQRATISWTEL